MTVYEAHMIMKERFPKREFVVSIDMYDSFTKLYIGVFAEDWRLTASESPITRFEADDFRTAVHNASAAIYEGRA